MSTSSKPTSKVGLQFVAFLHRCCFACATDRHCAPSARSLRWVFLLFLSLSLGSVRGTAHAQSGDFAIDDSSRQSVDAAALRTLWLRQDVVIDAAARQLVWTLGLFGTLGAIAALLQYNQHRRDERLLGFVEQQMAETKHLGDSYRANIDSITGLANSVKEVLDLTREAQQIVREVQDLKSQTTAAESRWRAEVDELNRSAVKIAGQFTRDAHNDPALQRAIEGFCDRFAILERSGAVVGVNANCHLVRGFHHRIRNDYQAAVAEFQLAIEVAKRDVADPDAGSRYPFAGDQALVPWLTKLQNVAAYHWGIIVYNLGQYSEARAHFERARKLDPGDVKSLTYIPEAMALGGLAEPVEIEAKFHDVLAELRRLPEAKPLNYSQTRDDLLSQVHLKLGNFYLTQGAALPKTERVAGSRATVLYGKAEACFREGLRLDGKSPIAKLSLAQTLQRQNRGTSERVRLFAEVLEELKTRVARITEAKIRMMYYYMLAICAENARVADDPRVYTLRLYELVPELPEPKQLRIFSPLTKLDLTVPAFLGEVADFERGLSKAAR